jgi:hypothetical protein
MKTMVSYTVGVTFPDETVAEEWLAWLRGGHIADVIAGGAVEGEVFRMAGPEISYEVRYWFPSMEVFTRYEQEFAPKLRAEGQKLFPTSRGIAYRRSTGTSVELQKMTT